LETRLNIYTNEGYRVLVHRADMTPDSGSTLRVQAITESSTRNI
jgi:hypothetical protein